MDRFDKSINKRSTASVVCSAMIEGWERRMSSIGLDGACLRYLNEFSDLIAERLHSKGLHACVDCDILTDEYWRGVAMCSQCRKSNSCIQQMLAVGIRGEVTEVETSDERGTG